MISRTVLVAAESFSASLDAPRVAAAIARGLTAGDPPLEVDACAIEGPLDALDFNVRMRRARAVVIAAGRLDHETLLHGETAFEVATRARQAGVPCYAVLGCNALDLFEARILDLQVVLEASTPRALAGAGRKLAGLV